MNDIDTTVMGIRELLMEYYKGTCIDRLSGANNVAVRHQDTPRLRYQYQRVEHATKAPLELYVRDAKVLEMHRLPDTLVLLNATLGRSKELRDVREAVLKFMDTYLKGVRVEEKGRLAPITTEDTGLLRQEMPQPRYSPMDWANSVTTSMPINGEYLNSIIEDINGRIRWE